MYAKKGNIMLVWYLKTSAFAILWINVKLYMYFGLLSGKEIVICDPYLEDLFQNDGKKERR
jgi:hypothetical protein